ncbi:helix-turn-helix domain-containing protein [Leuconostoc gasicomitatum]|uniref:helix-turn-helix domain-containing protein n=1 Tax=Leuconostoc gasicomitatum TaxID=115778 RepID=UPI001CC46DA8|nr:helix-turn-helix transcriptional regulator [Leuconostoc gasicomitatum]MBZ5958178.1 helix-turn-helix transcriptional regulator [Leuconostoc gasicomitatum]
MTLVSRTKEMAKQRGLSLKLLASKAGLAENAIYRWDDNNPKSENLEKVADILSVSTDYLLGRTDKISLPSDNNKIDLKDALDNETILAFDGMEIAEEDKEKLREYARFVVEQRQRGNR